MAQGMQGSIDKAEEVVARTQSAFMLQQFESAANPEIHYKTTGPEIWRDTAGTVDFLVAGAVGTGCGASLRMTHARPSVWPATAPPRMRWLVYLGALSTWACIWTPTWQPRLA